MRTVTYKLEDLKTKVIHIGKVAENDATRVQIDAGSVFAEYPAAVPTMSMTNPDGTAFPVSVERSGDMVLWDVKDSALAAEGQGEIQFTFTDGNTVKKSVVGRVQICRSIVGDGEAPDPVQDWLTEADAALEEIENISATAETLAAGSAATASYADGVLSFGIPQGAQGAPGQDGQDGADGQDGVSPTVAVTTITGGHTVTITDAQGDHAFNVMDGTAGAVIDDTSTAADKVWSASKTNELKSAITSLPNTKPDDAFGVDLDVTDTNGNVIVRMKNGHVQTKNFDSADADKVVQTTATSDLDMTDNVGNVILRLSNGHIQTKNFDSRSLLHSRMEFGAHNGAEYYAPECTVPAYRIAGQQGWKWAWIAGIAFSSEGSMYVIHDDTVDRTTDGTGYINQMTDAQIDALNITQTGSGYNLSDFDPAELKIPTLEQVVQQCVRYGMKMVLRLSLFPNGKNTPENTAIWEAFEDIIHGYGIQPEDMSCYLDTGTKALTCRTLFGEDVEISTHLGINATAQDFVDWFESRELTGRRAAILSYQQTNLEAVKLLHSHGIRCYSYGTNLQANADNCASWGVDIYQNGKIHNISY